MTPFEFWHYISGTDKAVDWTYCLAYLSALCITFASVKFANYRHAFSTDILESLYRTFINCCSQFIQTLL